MSNFTGEDESLDALMTFTETLNYGKNFRNSTLNNEQGNDDTSLQEATIPSQLLTSTLSSIRTPSIDLQTTTISTDTSRIKSVNGEHALRRVQAILNAGPPKQPSSLQSPFPTPKLPPTFFGREQHQEEEEEEEKYERI
eukprot:g3998.t1